VDQGTTIKWGSRCPWEGTIWGKGMPRHARRHYDASYAKTAEPIEMPFGLWLGLAQGTMYWMGGADPPMGRGNFERKDMPPHVR